MGLIKTVWIILVISVFLYVIGALAVNNGKIIISTAAVAEFAENTKGFINNIKGIKQETENSSAADIAKQELIKLKNT